MYERGIRMIRQTLEAAPVQYEGELVDGRCFYFRARHGGWSFGVGATHDDAVAAAIGELPAAFHASSSFENASYMSMSSAERLIDDCVLEYFATKPPLNPPRTG